MPHKDTTVIYRWMEEVWNQGNENAIDNLLDDNSNIHGIAQVSAPGPEGFKVFFKTFREQFPELHVEVEDVVSEEDLEFARCYVRATNAAGQKVEFTGMTCIRIQNGKITEGWNNFDFMSMYEQLGYKMIQPKEMIA